MVVAPIRHEDLPPNKHLDEDLPPNNGEPNEDVQPDGEPLITKFQMTDLSESLIHIFHYALAAIFLLYACYDIINKCYVTYKTQNHDQKDD